MPKSIRSFLAAVQLTHNRCRVAVRDDHACGGSTRDAKVNAMRIAADMLEFADNLELVASVDDNVVTILAVADWDELDFAQSLLDVAEHCSWDDRGVQLIGDVRSDIGLTKR